MDLEDFSLTISLHGVGPVYQLELRHRVPDSDALIAPARSTARFDLRALLALEANESAYGKTQRPTRA